MTPAPHGMPPAQPAPSGDNEGHEMSEHEGVPPSNVYIHTALPNAQAFNHDLFAKDYKHDQDCIPDLLTDEGKTTGWYTMCWVVFGLTFILQTGAAN